ncbi:hypothetical protein HU200_063372 [Digitaria exilis]|uniref:Uncharacterized protein n=1 Tax=Digitaria exilis TaxID=1010633 RepID=A0A835A1S0_9POAL|nr:hypothetical protein HU200_063372 [Digitaria exilis]
MPAGRWTAGPVRVFRNPKPAGSPYLSLRSIAIRRPCGVHGSLVYLVTLFVASCGVYHALVRAAERPRRRRVFQLRASATPGGAGAWMGLRASRFGAGELHDLLLLRRSLAAVGSPAECSLARLG